MLGEGRKEGNTVGSLPGTDGGAALGTLEGNPFEPIDHSLSQNVAAEVLEAKTTTLQSVAMFY
jgi:hypothetical protein